MINLLAKTNVRRLRKIRAKSRNKQGNIYDFHVGEVVESEEIIAQREKDDEARALLSTMFGRESDKNE